VVCRVFFRALDKKALCQVPKEHSAKKTLGKEGSLPSVKKTLGKENFKSKFEALNKFKSKSFELQSCITSQDLQSLFWQFLHLTK